jgi:nicotinamide-nucleotide amidase
LHVSDAASHAIAEHVGTRAAEQGVWVGVAESLTGGLVVQALARADSSSDWLRGGVVAYAREVKHGLLGVTDDKVVSDRSALEMAAATRRLLGADIAVAVTGVGGPDEQDGEAPGTVWIAVDNDGHQCAEVHRFTGDPSDVCESAVRTALSALDEALTAP